MAPSVFMYKLNRMLGRKRGVLVEDEKKKGVSEQSGQTPTHILLNALLQFAMTIAFVFNVKHETFPKPPDVPDPPGLGALGECSSL